jgi:hypothetical protein
MISVPLIADNEVCVDEETAHLLARYRVAFIHVVRDGEALMEAEFNTFAIFALTQLKVIVRTHNVEEDRAAYCLRNRAKLTTGAFRTLCDLLEARIRAVKAGDGSFLRPTLPVQSRLERRHHLSETF